MSTEGQSSLRTAPDSEAHASRNEVQALGGLLDSKRVKPKLNRVTLIAVDTTAKAHLAVRAINRSLEQCDFASVKLLTNNPHLKYAVTIPKLDGLEAYSKFCIRELTQFVDTEYCLLVQSDGYVLNGTAWIDDFEKYDWIGSPWNPGGTVGNGGFSWRSKKLLNACANLKTEDNEHPEDSWISFRHKSELEQLGIKIAPNSLARRFGFEGRSYNGVEWQSVPNKWEGQFGFHSFLSVLPNSKKPCKVFHHTGDWGDVIYSMPAIKALGGGVLFLSADNRFPYPRTSRLMPSPEWVNNISPLLEEQDYVWKCSYTHGLPFSTDYDLNRFRLPWKNRTAKDYDSIFKLHCEAFNVIAPESEAWLTVKTPITVPGRPIVVSRSPRYHNDHFPWYALVQKYGDRMVVVGHESEATLFQGFGAPNFHIPYYPTKDFLHLAQVIAGAKVFIGNQSAPLAVALGLGQNVISETWPQNANCKLRRRNAIHWESGPLDIPKAWLK